MVSPNVNSYQGFPFLGAPLVEPESGLPTRTWARLLISLWQRTGGSVVPNQSFILLVSNGDGTFTVKTLNGTVLGTLDTNEAKGASAQPQALAASPFTFTATLQGTLVISSGQISLSRDAGVTYYQVSLTGGAVPLLNGDKIQVIWYGSAAPLVTFFPTKVVT